MDPIDWQDIMEVFNIVSTILGILGTLWKLGQKFVRWIIRIIRWIRWRIIWRIRIPPVEPPPLDSYFYIAGGIACMLICCMFGLHIYESLYRDVNTTFVATLIILASMTVCGLSWHDEKSSYSLWSYPRKSRFWHEVKLLSWSFLTVMFLVSFLLLVPDIWDNLSDDLSVILLLDYLFLLGSVLCLWRGLPTR